ncbi:MAG: zf-HC2 domain-containing protein [Oscillospiraceae bacterium]|nr:zf-HC2 domain-containing protein [Oscillospiraceae bacterium]
MYKCSIIEDLIPLYKEGLCSEDTALMVEEHIKECEACRRLCEDISAPESTDVDTPDESKVFNRVNRKMKMSRKKIIGLSVVLIIILGILGVLTAGQITRAEGMISFETIVQSIETYRIAKLIANGDMDAYAGSISTGDTFDYDLNTYKYKENIRDINKQVLNDGYMKYLSKRQPKLVASFGWYETISSITDDTTICNHACIQYKDGSTLYLEFVTSYDGKYLCIGAYPNDSDGAEDIDSIGKIITYANIPKHYPDGLDERIFCTYDKKRLENRDENYRLLMSYWFVEEERDKVNSGMISYYKKGFTIEKYISSRIRYDEERSMLYHYCYIEGRDDQGTAVMTVKMYSTPSGLIPPAEEDREIIPNGCSDELINSLYSFFG